MTPRHRARRVLAGLAAAAAVVVVTALLGLEPEPVRVVLLVLLALAAVTLVLDALQQGPVLWYPTPTHPPLAQGRDEVMQSHLRMLENHRVSRHPDAAVRDRLAGLADRVLRTHHGVGAASERGRALLGPEVDAVLHGPVVRLTPRRIDRVLRTIEELS